MHLNLGAEASTFLRDGRVPLDSNAAERLVKPYASSRRNFLFVQNETSGEPSAIATTLIQTAAANGLDPRAYLEWVLSNASRAAADPDSFLPWSPTVPEWAKAK